MSFNGILASYFELLLCFDSSQSQKPQLTAALLLLVRQSIGRETRVMKVLGSCLRTLISIFYHRILFSLAVCQLFLQF